MLEKAAAPCKQVFLLVLSDTGPAIATPTDRLMLCSPETFTLKKLLCNGKLSSSFYINFSELIAYNASSLWCTSSFQINITVQMSACPLVFSW